MGRRKALNNRERDSLPGPHEEAEIQPKALRQGKNVGLQQKHMLKKKRLVEGDPKESWNGIEAEREVE